MEPKVALVYDRVNTTHGGAELVLQALHQAFPEAPLHTSVYHPRAKWADNFDVRTSFLQRLPFAPHLHRYLTFLMPLAFESFNLDEYDIIISITSAEAKGVITKPNQLHICYLLTPTRHLYSHRTHYEKTHWPFQIPILSQLSRAIFNYLTWWDQAAASKPDKIIPISQLVSQRIQDHYQRNAETVIYPPIDLDQLKPPAEVEQYLPYYLPQDYFLVISRLVSYKRIELAIQACQKLQKNLVIIGDGPQFSELENMAGEGVIFLGEVSQLQKQAVLDQAQGLIMPGVEDFGITALEAVMSKVPVIIHQESGVSELLDSRSAHFLKSSSLSELVTVLSQFDHTKYKFSPIKKKLGKYAITGFIKRFKQAVFKFWKASERTHERS